MQIWFEPSRSLNAGVDGASRSVLVRVFQLADVSTFGRLRYQDVWSAPGNAPVADALVEPMELRLVPGTPQRIRLRRHPEASAIAVAGKFRVVSGRWLQLAPLPPAGDACERDEDDPPIAVHLEAAGNDLRRVQTAGAAR